MKSVTAIAVVLIAALALSGCANTIRGVGKDVKQTGAAIQDAAS